MLTETLLSSEKDLPLPNFGSGNYINKKNNQQNNNMTAMSVAPYTFEEISIERDNVVTLEGSYENQIQANDILSVFKALVEYQEDIKCIAKINLENKPLYEVILKDYNTKAAIKAMIGNEIKVKNQVLKLSENRDVKEIRRVPLTTVIIYEAPYELDDANLYRVLSKYGDIKGNIIRHRHKGTTIENGNRSVIFNELPRNIPTVLWVSGNRIKIRYEGQDREAICSYCHQKGHYRKICEKMLSDKEEEERWRREAEEEEERRKKEEEEERRRKEEEEERERTESNQRLENFTNERFILGIKEREEKEKEERRKQLQRQEEHYQHILTDSITTTQEDTEMDSTNNSLPGNQLAYANAARKNNMTEKERKEKEKIRKRKEEDKKRIAEIKRKEKLKDHDNMSMVQLQKLLQGRKERDIKGDEKEALKDMKKRIKQRREEIMKEHGDQTN